MKDLLKKFFEAFFIKNIFLQLTKKELALWLTSVIIITASFFIAGNTEYLILTASLIGVTALIFVSKGMAAGQVLTIVFSVFYGIISYHKKYYGEMLTYLGMTAPIALMAVISWLRHPFKGTAEVEISEVTKRTFAVLTGLSVIVTAVFYFILRALGNASLFWSVASVFTSFMASGLTFLRSPYYALGYSANDAVLIILWSLAAQEDISYIPMICCFAMFLLNDLYGFYNWRRIRKRQAGT